VLERTDERPLAVPELDLVLGFWGGNYSDPSTFTAQDVYTTEWILPAVGDGAR
jgi:hypothetical protein